MREFQTLHEQSYGHSAKSCLDQLFKMLLKNFKLNFLKVLYPAEDLYDHAIINITEWTAMSYALQGTQMVQCANSSTNDQKMIINKQATASLTEKSLHL